MARVRETNGEIMYTVIRFVAETIYLPMLMKIGTAMNAIRPGVYTGLRKAGDGFSCEICTGIGWAKHHREILSFIADFSELINQSIRDGASVTVDIAVEPEDQKSHRGVYAIHHDHKLLVALASCGAELEISIY